jgi:hypothetical protein
MKYHFLLFCLFVSVFLVSCDNNSEMENASSVVNKDTTLHSSDSIKILTNKYILKNDDRDLENVMEWPEIGGGVSKPISDRINAVISIDSVCGESIKEIQLNYKDCNCGIVGGRFDVNYNKKNILSLTISVETMSAYPDVLIRNYNFNTKTGTVIFLDSLLKKDSIPSLISKFNNELSKRMEEAKAIAFEDAEMAQETDFINNLFDKREFLKEDLKNFIITDKGITFTFEFGFPHVAQALEPASDFFISRENLKPYLAAGIEL